MTKRLKGRPKISDEIKHKAVADYRNGDDARTIAKRYGIGKSSVYTWLKQRDNSAGRGRFVFITPDMHE